jgi:HEPN domain-containing protein
VRHEAELLLEQGNEDIITADALIEAGRWYASVFFSHQAAEKYLKALHIAAKSDFLLTHDLMKLCKRLGAPMPVCEHARRLNVHYTTTRHPDLATGIPAELYDDTAACQYLAVAKEIAAWVKSKIA